MQPIQIPPSTRTATQKFPSESTEYIIYTLDETQTLTAKIGHSFTLDPFHSSLPDSHCRFALRKSTYPDPETGEPSRKTIFYTWLPPNAPSDEKQAYINARDSVMLDGERLVKGLFDEVEEVGDWEVIVQGDFVLRQGDKFVRRRLVDAG
ncbi:Cofilin [Arthrobotrys entomopaga]|nr:Cofilin [Arthrobotrys entomopaga]